MAGSACLATPTSTAARYTLSAATQASSATPTSYVKRNRARLEVDGNEFPVQGPNIYWLGLDENVNPNPSYPSKSRVLEIMAVAKAMGATTIRSTSLGVSFGTGLSVENALNTFKPEGSGAWDAIDFAVFAAKSYDLRLVIPLTDQYDYYHGGIPTFLRWRNLSSTDFAPFYDLNSDVYQDFRRYIATLLSHTSPYTNLSLATDPTILAFETGNELGGYTGKAYPPPVEWTTAISAFLKELAPQTLVMSGSYGVRHDELSISTVDLHSDHFYPTYRSRLSSSAKVAHLAGKPMLAGEYDWTNQYYLRYRWGYFVLLLPACVALSVWFMPKRWWPWTFSLRNCATCACCRRRGRRVKQRPNNGQYDRMEGDSTALTPLEDSQMKPSAIDRSISTTTLSILDSATPVYARPRRPDKLIDRTFRINRWTVSIFILLLALPLFGIIYTFLPTPISTFMSSLSKLETASSSSESSVVGDLYWSLFGRDDTCCAYVQHDDGYTLHYPSDPSSPLSSAEVGSGNAVVELTKHAWKVRGQTPFWAGTDFNLDNLDVRGLPVIACPQQGLQLPNGTRVGGI
ncbi:uncharacterized protein JCM15063_006052 [Sporobolomyces koalae]|uniref:uncharacterized protein n=1 Tax=Sporobolomyces koalae TaxID=500713 RepID=UPI00316BB918